ncbi:MAG: NB-ARC domain-containing protein [Cyanobacteria bacterium J06635_15]
MVDSEQILATANTAIFAVANRHLSDVETAIILGAIANSTYEEIAEKSGYSVNYIKRDIGPKLWRLLSTAVGEKVNKINFRQALECYQTIGINLSNLSDRKGHQCDWGEAPDVSLFLGRIDELNTLKQWTLKASCRLMALLGIGGIGKTTLGVKLARQIQGQFDHVIWRSLRNAPTLESLLGELVPFLSDQQETEADIKHLLKCLQNSPCLVILDNVETILQAGSQAGQYRSGYEPYGDLLRVIGESSHQSIVLLTSREKPTEIAMFEGVNTAVRSLCLQGSLEASKALIQMKGLVGTETEQQQLCNYYGCNPLALKIVATSIQDLFGGEIRLFLEQNILFFNNLRRLLDQQFERLSDLEKNVMYWLAINRELTMISELEADLVPMVSRTDLLEALESLLWRNLIERQDSRYTQQSVVMEHVIDRFIKQICSVLIEESKHQASSHVQEALALPTPLCPFHTHALIKAQAKDYVRDSQVRLVLDPIIGQLSAELGSKYLVEHCLQQILLILRTRFCGFSGYSSGNLINLLHHLQIDLTGYDFSHLTLWQAYLTHTTLHQVNFSHANLERSVWAQDIGVTMWLALSPDDRLVATGCMDGMVYVWNIETRQQLLRIAAHQSWVFKVAFSPDGSLLATVSPDQTVKLWCVATGQCLSVLRGHTAGVLSVCFSPDGSLLATGSDDQTIKLWDVQQQACLKTLRGHHGLIRGIDFHPQGNRLVSGSDDGTIRLWNLSTGQCLKVLQHTPIRYRSVAFHPSGKLLASCSDDERLVRLWNISTGETTRVFQGHIKSIAAVAFNPDGQSLASSGEDYTLRLWEVNTGQCLKTLKGHSSGIWAFQYSSSGKWLASAGSHDHAIRFWDTATGQCLNTLQGKPVGYRPVAFHPQGNLLAGGGDDHRVGIWNIASGQCLKTFQGHIDRIWSIAFNANGQWLASASIDNSLRIWDVETGECLRVLEGHNHWALAVAFAPQNHYLASGSGDRTVKIWDSQTGTCLHTLRGHTGYVEAVIFNSDGSLLASCCNSGTIRLWHVHTGECLKVLGGHSGRIWSIAFAPNRDLLASSGDDLTIRFWDAQTGKALTVLQGHTSSVWSVAFSSDGQQLASGSGDRTIRLWDVSNIMAAADSGQSGTAVSDAMPGHCLRILQDTSLVSSVAFSPDPTHVAMPMASEATHADSSGLAQTQSSILASSSFNGPIRLWDTQTAKCLKTLRPDRPYEGMNITGVKGLSEAQKATLQVLGAITT